MPSFLPHRINIYQWMKFLTLCPCASEPTILYNQETYLLSTGFCCVCVCLCPSEGGGTIAPDCAPSSIFDTSRVKRNTGRRIHTPRYTIDPFLLFLFYPQLFSLSLSLFLWISSTNFFSGNIARKYTSFSYKNKLSAKHSLFQRIVTTIGENRSLKSVA